MPSFISTRWPWKTRHFLSSATWMLRHATDACGLIDECEAELLAEDFIGSRGKLKLRVEPRSR